MQAMCCGSVLRKPEETCCVSAFPLYTYISMGLGKGEENTMKTLNRRNEQQPLIKSPITPSTTTQQQQPRLSRRKLKKKLRTLLEKSPLPAIQTVFISTTTTHEQNNTSLKITRTLDHQPPTTHQHFIQIVDQVKNCIQNPTRPLLPKLNQSGSSGSYFCRYFTNEDPDKIEIADGAMNPKWTKWAHRAFLAPLVGGFGRSCLIPNLSYLSEAAASLLDRRLETYIVPRTEVVSMSSPTFFYSWLDIRKPKLPTKPGSFQLFCQGFQDASIFFKNHPWPGVAMPEDESTHNTRKKKTKIFSLYRFLCGHRRDPDTDSEEENQQQESPCIDNVDDRIPRVGSTSCRELKDWVWTSDLMDDFRVEMEKLVILDYLMRNTDRGLDNFMIKVCPSSGCGNPKHRKNSSMHQQGASSSTISQEGSMNQEEESKQDYRNRAHCHVAAIDNSLAFPHHHPNGWRSYAYGWLFLPASLIGKPFSRRTREHFLPLLTSRDWWAETVHEFRKLFGKDPDFNVAMFEKQMAVMKGQGWNIVESLKQEEEGPLELCRRQRALVWDEPVQLIRQDPDPLDDRGSMDEFNGPRSAPDHREPYLPTSPMTIVPLDKRPLIQRAWSSRTSHSQKIPPRPVGLASHHLTLDGARGLDVIKQMDALDAWHTESEIQVPKFRTLSAHYHSSKNHFSTHHYRKVKLPRSQNLTINTSSQKSHHASFRHLRTKSDGSLNTNPPSSTTQKISKYNLSHHLNGPVGECSSNNNLNQQTRDLIEQQKQSKDDKRRVIAIDQEEENVVTVIPTTSLNNTYFATFTNNNDHDHEVEMEADDEMDLNDNDNDSSTSASSSLLLAIIEKLQFVNSQPVFKNC